MIGIYKITCNSNNKCYIGQSVAIQRRIATHKRELRNNEHYNKKLQRAYNKYGKDSFSYEILELCPKDKLNDREKFYINIFDSHNNGFNQDDGGSDICGEKNPMYGIKGKDAPRFKDYILKIDLDGNIIDKFESTISAAESVSGNPAHVLGCLKTWQGKKYCNRNRFTHKNYQWIYEKDFNVLKQFYNFSKRQTNKNHITLQDIDKGALNGDV